MDFRVTTSADLNGLRQLSSMLDEIHQKSRSITQEFARMQPASTSTSVASGGGVASSGNTYKPRPNSNAGVSYNLNTQQGLEQWVQNVMAPQETLIQQILGGFSGKTSGLKNQRQQRLKGPLDKIAGTQNAQDVFDWFSNLQPSQMKNDQMRSAYSKAFGAAANMTSTQTPQEIMDFANQYGGQLGFNSGGGSGGGSGGTGGGYGSSRLGPSSATQAGSALGSLAKQYMPWITTGGAIMHTGSQVAQGYSMWQQSSSPIDQLAHSLGSATKDVESFRQQVSSAGAQFGYSMQQSAQASQMLTQAFGNIGQSNLVSLFGNTAQFSYNNGLSLQQGSQIMSSSAQLGITQGYGSSLTASQFQGMLGNATNSAGMQGRQGPFYTGMLSAANSVVAQNGALANPTYFSGMYSQSVNSMGGMRGGSLFDQFNNSVMNASGYTQGIAFAAMQKTLGSKASSTSLVSLLGAQQGGLSSFVPGTHTTLGASLYQYITGSGMSQDQQIMALAPYFGGNVNEAKEFLRNKGFGTKSTSTKNTQSTWYSLFGRNQQAIANHQLGQSDAGYMTSPFATAFQGMGFGSDAILSGLGLRYAGSFLGGIVKGDGFGGGLRAAGSKISSDLGALSKLRVPLSNLFKRAAPTAEKAAEDVTKTDGMFPMSYSQIQQNATNMQHKVEAMEAAKKSRTAPTAHITAVSSHAATATAHAEQVRQQAAQRTSSHLSNLTIDQLKINQITFPGWSASSSGGSALMNALTQGSAATAGGSGSSSGGTSWWGDFTHWVGNLFGGSSGGGNSSIPTSLSGNGNAQQVFNFLTSKGLTSSAAAGIMGNLQQESSMNPNAPGGGLAQWIGSRQTALDTYAKQNGANPNSLNTQLGFLWKELSSGQYGSISALNNMNASQAAQYFEQTFEKAGVPMMNNRTSYANSYYNEFAGNSTPTVHLSQASISAIGKAVNGTVRQVSGVPTSVGAVRP